MIWASDRPRMLGHGKILRPGEEVPSGHFSEAEIAVLVERGKIAIDNPRVVDASEEHIELDVGEKLEPKPQPKPEPPRSTRKLRKPRKSKGK